MQKIFRSLRELDKRAEEHFNLKNGLLMEHAAAGMAGYIKARLSAFEQPHTASVQIVCGSGDNGGDGLALARLLAGHCIVRTVAVKEPKSALAKLQKERLDRLGIPVYTGIDDRCDILVDALLGTGFCGILDEQTRNLINRMNMIAAYKIACDIPTGLNENGSPAPDAFRADVTLSMGALKESFYSDAARDYTGSITVIDLGIPRSSYETNDTDTFLLSYDDMRLPHRNVQNTHKMNYGHAVFVCGEKQGAALLAASAALHFGAGLVTLCGEHIPFISPDYMYSSSLPESFSVCGIGSGLGRSAAALQQFRTMLALPAVQKKPIVLDADVFYDAELPGLLHTLTDAVLTPHPKEFRSLLLNSKLADSVSVAEIQEHRFEYVRKFCRAYPQTVLLLKGAYPVIGHGDKLFVNPLATNALAKAGSGDVLTGMIAALLGQGYPPEEAAVSASLAHAAAAQALGTGYGITPSSLAQMTAQLT